MNLVRRTAIAILCCTTIPAAAADPTPPALRLGDAAAPVSYEAHLAIDPRQDAFSADIRIAVTFNRAAPVLWLNASALTVESAEVEQAGRTVAVTAIPGGEDFVGLVPREGAFEPGPAVVSIRYRGGLDATTRRGAYRQDEAGEWYVITQFEAISARFAFPCFDEPGWKTPWRLTIDAPASDVVVSNTTEESAAEAPGRSGWRRHVFATTKPLPTYLVAFAVGPFDVVDGGTAGSRHVPLRYFTPKGRAAEARYAREVTPRIVSLLEDYFGIPYPFDKLDSVSVPQGGGAMENAGMITYNTRFLLARAREETDANHRSYVSIAAHEIAHHWFGDYVTLAWWDDIWLNEAFATWMAEKILFEFRPAWDNGLQHATQRRRAVDADRLDSARRVKNPVTAKGEIRTAFDRITYDKGGEVLAMFESAIGPELFRKGVHEFLASHAYGSATSGEFYAAIAKASGRPDAVAAFTAFIEQPGVPLVEATLECGAGHAVLDLSQHRLRPTGSKAADLLWKTPACFRYESSGKPAKQCVDVDASLRKAALSGSSCPAWIVGNADGRGHYLVRYDPRLAKRAVDHFGSIPAHEAVAFLDDTELLARSGLVGLEEALARAEAGFAHRAPVVQDAAVYLMLGLRDAWLTPGELEEKRRIVATRAAPIAARLGWNERAGEAADVRHLRTVLLPFVADSQEGAAMRSEARALALRWIADRNALSSDMSGPVLVTAARFADEATFDALEQALVSVRDQRDRGEILRALAKTRDAKLRERAFAASFMRKDGADVLNGSHVFDLLEFAMFDDASRAAAFAYLRANYEPLAAKMPKDTAAYLMRSLSGLCTSRERDAFRDFFAPRAPQFLGGDLAYRQTLEAIDLCVAARGGERA
ncbi:MAG: M1 family aminopeptidase [Usitatibacter sp.]